MKKKICIVISIIFILIATMFITQKSYAIQKSYKGYNVVGEIEIPKTNLKLPILDTVTKSSLETSVAVLYTTGNGVNTIGNTVISGLNLRNGMLFSNNALIEIGDKIYITDLNDNKEEYVVYNTYTTIKDDSTFMTRDTNGEKEITLLSPTDDNELRIVIWAKFSSIADETPEVTPNEKPNLTPAINPDEKPNETPETKPDEKPNETPETKPDEKPNETSETKPKQLLPFAGNNTILFWIIVGLSTFSYFLYRKYKKYSV